MYFGDGEGGGFLQYGEGLSQSAQFLMERSEEIKDFILTTACEYLKKYYVERLAFSKDLYNEEIKK